MAVMAEAMHEKQSVNGARNVSIIRPLECLITESLRRQELSGHANDVTIRSGKRIGKRLTLHQERRLE